MEKLAGYLGQKKSSVSANYSRAKGRFQAILGERSPRKSASANAASKSGAAGETINLGDTDPGTPVKKSRSRKHVYVASKAMAPGETIGSNDTDPDTPVKKPRSRKRVAAEDASSDDEAEAKRQRLAPWAAWIASVGVPRSPSTAVPNYPQQAASEAEEAAQIGMANKASDLTE
jgi:hypothetical protein